MIKIDPQSQTERENYKLLIGSVIPRPIAFVTTMDENGIVNGAPFSYFNVVSSNPPMLSVSIQRKNGTRKDTAKNIVTAEEFVVHIVDEDNLEKINETAASLPYGESEMDHAGLELIASDILQTPGIVEAKVRYECELVHTWQIKNDGVVTGDFFIGRIVRFHVDEAVYEAGKINYDALKAVSRLAGHDYAKIGELLTMARPE